MTDACKVASEAVVAVEGAEGESPTVEVDEECFSIVDHGLIATSVKRSSSTGNGARTNRSHLGWRTFSEGTRQEMRGTTIGDGCVGWVWRRTRSEVVKERLEVRVDGWHARTVDTIPRRNEEMLTSNVCPRKGQRHYWSCGSDSN